ITTIRPWFCEKSPEIQRIHEEKYETTTRGRAPSPPTWEDSERAPRKQSAASAEVGHVMDDHPKGQGTPCRVPRQPLSTVPFNVLTCMEGQTTSESYETRTVASVLKIASQWFKNHIDLTSVIREKTQKPKDTRRKRRNDGAWPSPEPPNMG